jgi:hypothetical protein
VRYCADLGDYFSIKQRTLRLVADNKQILSSSRIMRRHSGR